MFSDWRGVNFEIVPVLVEWGPNGAAGSFVTVCHSSDAHGSVAAQMWRATTSALRRLTILRSRRSNSESECRKRGRRGDRLGRWGVLYVLFKVRAPPRKTR